MSPRLINALFATAALAAPACAIVEHGKSAFDYQWYAHEERHLPKGENHD